MFQTYVASVSYGCCKSRSGCRICCKCLGGMLQEYVQNVPSVSHVCCKYCLDVAYVPHICCKRMFQMFNLFQSYVAASVSYCKCRPLALVLTRAVWPSRGHQCGEEVQVTTGGVGRRHRPRDAVVEDVWRVIRTSWERWAREVWNRRAAPVWKRRRQVIRAA